MTGHRERRRRMLCTVTGHRGEADFLWIVYLSSDTTTKSSLLLRATVSVNMGHFSVCFYGFGLSCPVYEAVRYRYRRFVYFLVLLNSVLF